MCFPLSRAERQMRKRRKRKVKFTCGRMRGGKRRRRKFFLVFHFNRYLPGRMRGGSIRGICKCTLFSIISYYVWQQFSLHFLPFASRFFFASFWQEVENRIIPLSAGGLPYLQSDSFAFGRGAKDLIKKYYNNHTISYPSAAATCSAQAFASPFYCYWNRRAKAAIVVAVVPLNYRQGSRWHDFVY